MTPEEIAARFDTRPGYRVIDYGLVGLPVFKVTSIGTFLERSELDPIEEFILRAVHFGLRSPNDVAAFLGLSDRVVGAVISSLIQRELLGVRPGQEHTEFLLTPKGRIVIETQAETRPKEAVLVFTYDALLRAPKYFGESRLFSLRELKDRGIPDLRPNPNRGPELKELELQAVSEVFRLSYGSTAKKTTLLRINSVERRLRLYCEAVALAFRSDDGRNTQIAFAIDGRLSEAHELAFADRGLERNHLFAEVAGSANSLLHQLDADVRERLQRPETARGRAQLATARSALIAAEQDLNRSRDTDREQASAETVAQARRQLDVALREGGIQDVRFVEVYEHPMLLRHALESSRSRLVIVSPWIRAAIVDEAFFRSLAALLKRGVSVFIGYGIDFNDQKEMPEDKRARERLHAEAQRNPRLVVTRLGDTHAKVLIVDSDYYVITSFNWLSFRGDRSRKFREEYGTYVGIPGHADALFRQIESRLIPSEPPAT